MLPLLSSYTVLQFVVFCKFLNASIIVLYTKKEVLVCRGIICLLEGKIFKFKYFEYCIFKDLFSVQNS